MVKLPETDGREAMPTEEETWAEICRVSNEHNTPTTLLELEEFAEIASHLIPLEGNMTYLPRVQMAMNKLREVCNLEFKLRCEVCGGAHNQDEITAPER